MSTASSFAASCACVLIGLGLLLGGCSSELAQHRLELERLHAAGLYARIAERLDQPQVRRLYEPASEVLWQLDRAAVALALGDDDTVVRLLNAAEDQIELTRGGSSGDVLARWTLNDAAARYLPEPYEDMYLNVFKLLAHLRAGRLDNGATVEARRAARKADLLRDRFLLAMATLDARTAERLGPHVPPPPLAHGQAGQFIESPLGTFLTAITFLKTGDTEFHRVAARRLRSSLALQQNLIGPVRAEDFARVDELAPSDVNVLVVAFSGRGPTKHPVRVGPIPLGTIPVYFELPDLRVHPGLVSRAYVDIEGSDSQDQPLALIEDLGAVAAENHRRTLPAIYARTLLRYAIKAGISVAATEAARRQAGEREQMLVQAVGVIGGLLALAATEQADLRCWTMLPGQARVGLLRLSPGQHRLRVRFLDHAGHTLHLSPWHTVTVADESLTTVVAHYWN